MDHFFNTTNEVNPTLKQFEAKAKKQEDVVLNIFRKSQKGLTPGEVFDLWPNKRTPITSVRRAVTNLMNNKLLEKTGKKRKGEYGRNETEYRLFTGQLAIF